MIPRWRRKAIETGVRWFGRECRLANNNVDGEKRGKNCVGPRGQARARRDSARQMRFYRRRARTDRGFFYLGPWSNWSRQMALRDAPDSSRLVSTRKQARAARFRRALIDRRKKKRGFFWSGRSGGSEENEEVGFRTVERIWSRVETVFVGLSWWKNLICAHRRGSRFAGAARKTSAT